MKSRSGSDGVIDETGNSSIPFIKMTEGIESKQQIYRVALIHGNRFLPIHFLFTLHSPPATKFETKKGS